MDPVFTIPELTSLTAILTDKTNGYTLCEAKGRSIYKFIKNRYAGDWRDLAQAGVVGLLEWAKTQPDTEKLNMTQAQEVIRRAVQNEWSPRSQKQESRGDGDYEWGEDKYFDPEDTRDYISPERAKAIASAFLSVSEIVGENEALILRLRLTHGLSFEAIRKRFKFNPRSDPDFWNTHTKYLLGYPRTNRNYSVEQLEDIFNQSINKLRAKFEAGELACIMRCLNFSQAEAELRAETRDEMKRFKSNKGEV